MSKKKSSFVIIAFITFFIIGGKSNAQDQGSISFQNRLKDILSNFNNFRFSSVSFYEINDKQVRSLKEIIKKKIDMEEEADTPESQLGTNQNVMDSARTTELVNEIRRLIAAGKRSLPDVRKAFNGDVDEFEHLEDYNANDVELKIAFQLAQGNRGPKSDIYQMFLVTTTVQDPVNPPSIIALILCKERVDKDEYEQWLIPYYNQVIGNSVANEKNVLTEPELMNFIIDEESDETKTTNLYDKLILEFRQGNCQLITQEVRGIGSELKFIKSYGKTTSMIINENDISDMDIEKFIRISDAQPNDYQKNNELIISDDLLSWKKYTVQYYEDEEGNRYPISAANTNLPNYGAELKYGMDEINYPSFWTNRMSLRAIWDNIKVGVILPTSGWSMLSEDLYNIDRTFTYAGLGVSANIDFPIKIIPSSGIFNFTGSYVFGDAKEATYKNRQDVIDEGTYHYDAKSSFYNDYLVRYTGQFHYTFGIAIDEGYLMRFGIGATLYGMETWHDFEEENSDGEMVWNYKKSESETIGGMSMKAEFMVTNVTTPFGASLQYFDESLSANAWLQIPVVTDAFFVRVDVKGYVAAFKDEPRVWEKESMFMPNLRLIFNF